MSTHLAFIVSVPEEHAAVLEAAAASRGMTLRGYCSVLLADRAFAMREQFAAQIITNRLYKAATTLPEGTKS